MQNATTNSQDLLGAAGQLAQITAAVDDAEAVLENGINNLKERISNLRSGRFAMDLLSDALGESFDVQSMFADAPVAIGGNEVLSLESGEGDPEDFDNEEMSDYERSLLLGGK